MVLVTNNTDFGVLVVVMSKSGGFNVVSLAPGRDLAVEVPEGRYGVSVHTDKEWIAFAKEERVGLVQLLSYPTVLGPDQIIEVLARLQQISDRIKQLEAKQSEVGCIGTVTSDGGGVVEIGARADGVITMSCN
jgi:hypothetical protein